MDPISAHGSFFLFLVTALSVKAGSLANDALPHREAALTSVDVVRQNEAILPVEVDISDLVSNFNVRFQALEDNVTRLGEKFRIIETKLQTSMEEADDLREQLKASNEQKGLVEKELAELKGSAAAGAGAGDDDDDTGSAEEDTVLMQNNGTPGATSFDNNSAASKLPKYAFENTLTYDASGYNYWLSKRGMPQYIWMKFATPHRIAKLGFSSQSNAYAPTRFDIIGSSNCAKRDGDAWMVLLHVAESGFPADDIPGKMTKTWSIPQQNRREYACIGLKIELSNNEKNYVALKNIQMWEEA